MSSKKLPAASLKGKMTLAVLLMTTVVLTIAGGLAFQFFEREFKASLARQQFTLVSALAEQIDGKIRTAQQHLVAIARILPPEIVFNPRRGQEFLAGQLDDEVLFDCGIFLFSASGELVAAIQKEPLLCNGTCPLEPYLQATLETGTPQITSLSFPSHKERRSIVLFTAPLRGRDGRLIGVLAGGLDLLGDNFLGRLAQVRLGEKGYLYLYDRRRTLIMHPDRSRILEAVPEGDYRLLERALEGFEGTGETVNSRGLEVLASFAPLTSTDWILAANFPQAEAYAPLDRARRYFLLGLCGMVALTALGSWLVMRRLTAPLHRLHLQLRNFGGTAPFPHLPAESRDEIGALAGAFNQLLSRLARHEKTLQEQLEFVQVLIDVLPNPIFYKDAAGSYLGCNRAFEKFVGRGREELIGKTVHAIAPPDLAAIHSSADASLREMGIGKTQVYETSLVYADGERHQVVFYKATLPTPSGEVGGVVGTFLDITDRKRAETALEEQKSFSEHLLQNAAIAGFVLDRQHQVIAWNQACEMLTGIAAEEILGTGEHWRAFYDHRRPCLADIVIAGISDDMGTHYSDFAPSVLVPEGWQAEGWRTLKGEQRYVLFHAAPIRNGQGEIIAAIQTVEDLTDRRQTEENLARSFSLLQATLESTADGILVVDLEGTIIRYNRRLLDLWQIPEVALISGEERALDFVIRQLTDPAAFRTGARDLRSRSESESWETLQCRDGRVFECYSMPQYLQDRVVGRVWSFHDITRQQQMLEQLCKLSLAVEQSPNTVVITDIEGRIEYINQRFTEVSGYSLEEVFGQNPRILQAGDTPEEYYRTLWKTIIAGGEWRGEFHNKKKNGEHFWESALISPLKNAEGIITHFVAIKEDVTGKKLNEQRQKLTAQVLELLSLPNKKMDKIQDILQLLKDFTGIEGLGIRLRDGDDFPYYRVCGLEEPFVAAENSIGLDDFSGKPEACLCGKVLLGQGDRHSEHFTKGGSFWMNRQDPRPESTADPVCDRGECFRQGFQSMALIPLRSGDQVVGLIQLVDRRPDILNLDLVKFLEGIGISLGLTLEHRQTEVRLQEKETRLDFLTNYDPLTLLPNRTLFQDRLLHAMAKARRSGKKVALLLLDLDRFKTVNDSLGHDLGDRLLVQIAVRLGALVREGDTLARISGDEFVVILEDVEELKDVIIVAQKLLSHLSQLITLDGYPLYLTGSIGITLFPSDAEDLDSLLKYAEIAMYRAKEGGRNTYQFYRPNMNARGRELLLLESSLRQALAQEQLVLYFQPKVDLRSGHIIGAEALVRWRHPELGVVSPADFIPLAEETGLIVPIGEWILESACRHMTAWQKNGHPPLPIAVNISGRQFQQGNFIDVVGNILARTGLDPDLLELEITESTAMENAEETIRTLTTLKGMGVHLAIDDFGTGYSSLSYLRRFPIDCLKIDRSFVREIAHNRNDAAIATSIIALALGMKLSVVAEGIENHQQLDFLVKQGCEIGQGFLFSRPVPPEEWESLLSHSFPIRVK